MGGWARSVAIAALGSGIAGWDCPEQTNQYAEAQALGLTDAVKRSMLPEPQQRRLATAIVREARANNLDPLLVAAVIRIESSYDLYATSPAGALGLMQLMPATGRWLLERRGGRLARAKHLFDPELNLQLGSYYLAELIQQFGSIDRALVAYNAGPSAAKKILAKPASRKKFLAGYPSQVIREYRRLESRLARRPGPPSPAGSR